MIPDGSLEMQKETKNNENGKYVNESKWRSTAYNNNDVLCVYKIKY